jgi:hypothetical protein
MDALTAEGTDKESAIKNRNKYLDKILKGTLNAYPGKNLVNDVATAIKKGSLRPLLFYETSEYKKKHGEFRR